MPMNTVVPYLDVKNFFNPQEDYAGSTWQYMDRFYETQYADCIERDETPAWQRSFISGIFSRIRSLFG